MSRNRIGAEPEDSLDLLLDTICNTFGGIVFISILVVVMANMAGKSASTTLPDPRSQSELVDLEIQREASHARLARLRQAVADRNSAVKQFTSAGSVALAKEVERQNTKHTRNVQRKSLLLGHTSQDQIQINKIARAMKQRKENIRQQSSTLADLQKTLKTEVRSRSRSVDLPRLRKTTRKAVAFFLKNGRLYAVHRPGRHNSRWESLSLSNEVTSQTVGGRKYVDARAGAGTQVTDSNKPALKQKLQQFDSQAYYVQIFVWEDSFAQFSTIRKLLVDAHFEYALKPMPSTGRVSIGRSNQEEVQ